jgi:hypothetical protein
MWRYKLVSMGLLAHDAARISAWEAKLNELGGQGWEAIAVMEQADGWWVILKMPHEVGTY